MDPVILDSARKRQIPDQDILHAYRNAIYVVVDEDNDVALYFGGDRAGNPLEIGVVEDEDGTVVIIHAMPARPHKFQW